MSTHLGKYPGIFKRGCEFYIYIIETFGVLFLFFTFFLGWGGGGGGLVGCVMCTLLGRIQELKKTEGGGGGGGGGAIIKKCVKVRKSA